MHPGIRERDGTLYSLRFQSWTIGSSACRFSAWRMRPFAMIGLAIGAPVMATAATPEALQARVLQLRGEWR